MGMPNFSKYTFSLFLAISVAISLGHQAMPVIAAGPTANNSYGQGVLLYRAGRYREAAAYFWQSITKEDGQAGSWLYMAHSYLGARDVPNAIKTYETIVKTYPDQKEGQEAKNYLARLAPARAAAAQAAVKDRAANDAQAEAAVPKKSKLEDRIVLQRPKVGHPEVSSEVTTAVKEAMANIPKPVRKILTAGDIKFVLTTTMIDRYPEGAYQEVEGYEGGTSKSCPGLFDPSKDEIVLAQYTVDEANDELNRPIPNKRIIQTFLHECGHAVDHCIGRISMTDQYRHAYYLDIARVPDDMRRKLAYYLQKSTRGQYESCGQLLGIIMGLQDETSEDMQACFPNTLAFLKQKVNITEASPAK